MPVFIRCVVIFLFFALYSCEKTNHKNAVVVRNCTGTYLRVDGKDYQVCNLEKVESFTEGTAVKATFKKIEKCTGSANDQFVCYMLHPNEGWIEVEKIK